MKKYYFTLTSSTQSDYMDIVFEKLKELLHEEKQIYVVEKQTEETFLPINSSVFFFLDKEKRKFVSFRVNQYSEENNLDLTEAKVGLKLEFSCVGSVSESEFAYWLVQTKWNIVKQLE